MHFKPHEQAATIAFSKPIDITLLMLINASTQITGNTRIERTVPEIRYDVYCGLLYHGYWIASSLMLLAMTPSNEKGRPVRAALST